MNRLSLLLLSWILTSASVAAPEADLWERWAAHDTESTRTISHQLWNDFLARYVSKHPDGINRVAYQKVSDSDRKHLKSYLHQSSQINISTYNREEQLAYWINLYNALTLNLILEHLPVSSIREIKSGLFSSGPWGKKLISVEAQQLTLNDIEHRVLRPIWRDPRIHYAVNCASVGCPNLQLRAYTPANNEHLLEQAARDFINHPRGVKVVGNSIVASEIYSWFQEDFGASEKQVIEHFRQYANPQLQAQLSNITRIDSYQYDWNLNQSN